MFLAGPGIGLWRTVQKHSSNAGLVETLDGCICVRRRGIIVAPVNQSGDAIVNLVQGAGEVADIDVLGLEHGGQSAVHGLHVLSDCPVGREATQRRLPCVKMAVD